jgi:DNA repair protein RadA/Sms
MGMLLAVLEKRAGFRFGTKDVFLNIAGGIYVDDPAIDLGIVSALISSYEDKAIPAKIAFAAEVGLSGEIRAVNRIEQRIAEADKLGFDKIFISKYNLKAVDMSKVNIEVVSISKIQQLVAHLF